ncbi:MAG: DNA polymerase III subunit alpha [Alphaproteobacteria bacterium]|jgi:DNA polymerase-3 subunit alpha|nr:DNA polymerase III subunit alpha [Alphaproteobacteria bacterium]
MPADSFIHLRVHSAYSLSEGAIKVKDLVRLCQSHGMPAVAMTDSGNMFGVLEFALAAAEAGVQPITGTVLGLARPEDDAQPGRPAAVATASAPRARPDRIVLLVQSEPGYRNLMHLVSKAFLETDSSDVPHVSWADLEGHAEGLIALTGGPEGPVGRLLLENKPDAAGDALSRLTAAFPGRLYVELMRHGEPAEDRIEEALVDLAYASDVPLVATNDAYFADEGMYEAHDALLCIADGTYVSESDRRRVTPHHRFKSAEEMRTLFADLPEAVDNTLVIARRCHFMPQKHTPILPAYETEGGRSEEEELRAQSLAGMAMRLNAILPADLAPADREARAGPYYERLELELGIIQNMGFAGYFLIVADFIKWAKAQGIPVGPGRGSGGASAVAWALTITDLDPLRFGLLFERFLNPERVSMPDFDIDFCQDRRDEVIAYVADKYGHDKVAQIITFGKLQARAVLRDVGRVLQMPYPQVDRLCKLVPNNPAKPVTLQQAIDGEPQLQQARGAEEAVARLIDIALKLEGLYRHASTHAAGVVIGDRPLAEFVPLYRDPRAPMPVTQFNMKFVELAGLVKFDFLGLKTLTVLARARDLIRDVEGTEVDLAHLPLDDENTYAMLGRGETTGVFQLESSGMRDVLRRLKPTRFEDIIALVALYRPGPMDNIPTYIEVKQGRKQPDYLDPKLQPILEETYGIMIYQEQVMQVAQVLAGYSLGGADLLRRAMGKKIQAEMDAQKKLFVDGAVERQVDQPRAAKIFDQVAKFAGYGFNKAHAAGYALVAYQTGWLKANYPVAFFAASMTLDLGNTDKLAGYRQELSRLGLTLLPPDINKSEPVFSVEPHGEGGRAVRYALGAIKGVGVDAMGLVLQERLENGPFQSVFDFARRVGPRAVNKRQLEGLIRAGAFDSLEPNRARLMAGVDIIVRDAHSAADERSSGQISLFGGPAAARGPELPDMRDWDSMEKLRHEFDALGFYLSAHPVDPSVLARIGAAPSTRVEERVRSGGTRIKLAGVVIGKREATTKTGKRMAFVQLSDPYGQFEVLLFAEVLSEARSLLEGGNALVITVDGQAVEDGVRLTANQIEELSAVLARIGSEIRVFVEDQSALAPLKETLAGEQKGRCHVSLWVRDGAGDIEVALPGAYAISSGARAALRALPGVTDLLEL